MKKTIRNKLAMFMAATMAVSCFSVQVSAEKKLVPADGNAVVYYLEESSGAFDEASDITVWAGGGKATLSNGAIVDGKTQQLYLTSSYDDGNKWSNVTTSKSTVWFASSKNSAGFDVASGKFTADSTIKDYLKVSKGIVTAGKKPTDNTNKAYVLAVTNYDKKNANLNPVYIDPVQVHVKQAATTIQFISSSGKSGTVSTEAIKTVVAPLGDKATVYAQGLYKDGELKLADEENTFSVQVDKDSEFIGISTSANPTPVSSIPSIGFNDLRDSGIDIHGLELATNDKIAKASITITNNQSGKKAKLTVTVENPVVGQAKNDAIAFDVTSSGASADTTKEVTMKDYLTLSSSGKATTDAPKFIITALEINNTGDDKSEVKNQASFIDAKGKVKFGSSLKISDGIGKSLSAKYDKNTGKVTVTLKKTATMAATDATKTFNLICGYNGLASKDGKDLPGIIVIPITLTYKPAS